MCQPCLAPGLAGAGVARPSECWRTPPAAPLARRSRTDPVTHGRDRAIHRCSAQRCPAPMRSSRLVKDARGCLLEFEPGAEVAQNGGDRGQRMRYASSAAAGSGGGTCAGSSRLRRSSRRWRHRRSRRGPSAYSSRGFASHGVPSRQTFGARGLVRREVRRGACLPKRRACRAGRRSRPRDSTQSPRRYASVRPPTPRSSTTQSRPATTRSRNGSSASAVLFRSILGPGSRSASAATPRAMPQTPWPASRPLLCRSRRRFWPGTRVPARLFRPACACSKPLLLAGKRCGGHSRGPCSPIRRLRIIFKAARSRTLSSARIRSSCEVAA